MKLFRQVRALRLLMGMAILTMGAQAAQAQLTQEIPLDDAALQALMNPTLQTLEITAASRGGRMALQLPNGQRISRDINIGEVTIPMPDPFPGIVCTINSIRNAGAPTVRYQNGKVRLSMNLRPVNAGSVINTRWTSDSIFLPDTPGVEVGNIQVSGSFDFARRNSSVVPNDLQVQVNGDWTLRGVFRDQSPLLRSDINAAVANNIRAMLINDLNLLVTVSTAQYLQARARLTPVQLLEVRNEPARVLFTVRAPSPLASATSAGLQNPVLNPNTALTAGTATPRENATIQDWIGMWGDGATSENSRTVCMISRTGESLYIYAGEVAVNGSAIYKEGFENSVPRGSLLQPKGILRLQLVAMPDRTTRLRYNRAAYENFPAGEALLRRLDVAKVVGPTENRILNEPILNPKTDNPQLAAEDEKLRAIEEERKRSAEEAALQKPAGKPQDKVAEGGTSQIDATEGNLGDWLSNGIWRLRVLGIEPIKGEFNGRAGWGVNVEVHNINARKKTISLFNTGVAGKPILADEGGNPVAVDEGDWQTGIYFKELLPGQKRQWQIKFFYGQNEKPSAGPEKLIIEVDLQNGLLRDTGLKYTVSDPSFRVFLK